MDKPVHRISFQVRLFLSFLIIIFCFFPAVGYFGFVQWKRSLERQVQQNSLNTASQIAEQVKAYLAKHSDNTRLIRLVFEKGLIDPEDRAQLLSYFQYLKQVYPYFVNINYGDKNGFFLMVPPQKPEVHKLFDPRIRPWYKGALRNNGLYWTEVYIFASSQRPGITVSVPILDRQRKPFAVCSIDIDLSTLSGFLKKIRVGRHGYAFIIENSTGRIIAHPELPQLYENPSEIKRLFKSISTLKTEKRTFGATSESGKKFFTAYADYPENNWTIGVTLPASDFLANIGHIKQAAATIVFAAVLLASLMSYLLSRTVAKPLRELKEGFKIISDGDLDHEVIVRDRGIIGSLAMSFNRMSRSLKKSREELKKTYRTLAEKEKMAALGQLTAGIAHEIRNPLAIMLSSAQVVTNDSRPPDMRREAGIFIIEEINRLDKTLNDFLAFARPTESRLEECDLVEILDYTAKSMAGQLIERQIEVVRNLSNDHQKCRADSNQMRQVFINLILNAIQAMPEGGRLTLRSSEKLPGSWLSAKRVKLQPRARTSSYLEIAISDTGMGIDPDHLERIFEPFYSSRNDGTGLGLAIVYQILKMHQAGISVSSESKIGTTFALIFPCLPGV